MNAIRSVDPRDCDYHDLKPLLEAMAGVDTVLLGELSHGDGSAQSAKARIIRCLIEEMGFDTIGWEAGTYDCWAMTRALADGVDPAVALQHGLYGVWRNKETLSLFTHLAQRQNTGRPIQNFGFDCQSSSPIAARRVGTHLATWAAQLNLKLHSDELERLVTLFEASVRDRSQRLSPVDEKRLLSILTEFATVFSDDEANVVASLGHETAFVAQVVVANFKVQIPRIAFMKTHMDAVLTTTEERRWAREQETERIAKAREAAMAANLLLWRRRNPGRKIVCWMANAHASRNAAADVGLEFEGLEMMGDYLSQAEGDGCYSVGFLAYEGSTRTWDGRVVPLRDRPAGSVEHGLHELGHNFAFVDLRNPDADHWLHEPRPCFPLTEDKRKPVRLPRLFDGLFFIDEMRPTTPLTDATS